MKLSSKLDLKQTQKLVMTAQLHQAIEILQLPTLELEQKIKQELIENPFLEETQDDKQTEEELVDTEKEEASSDIELMSYFEDSSDNGFEYYGNETAVEHAKFVEKLLNRPETLQEHLLWQLRLEPLNEIDYKIGEMLISNINSNGYLECKIEDIANEMGVDYKAVEKVLNIIQTFEPYGVGARDLRECLLIQTKFSIKKDLYGEKILKDYFELLRKRKYSKIAKALSIDLATVQKSVNYIQSLDPNPGIQYNIEKPKYVVPDVMVDKVDGKFVIILNDEWIPRIRINKYYQELLKNKRIEMKTREFLKERFASAIWLIKAIEQRKTTIYKVTEAILNVQNQFFEKGVKYLAPLVLRQIAEMINMHPSTVSRVTTNKYIQTPWGIYELKYFFSSKLNYLDGSKEISSRSVKEIIMDIIENVETKTLSDREIEELLKADGIKISRRTVAKYRKNLKILPSYLR